MSYPMMPYSRNVYIASLPADYTDAQLLALFTPYGQVLSHSVKTDKATGKCKGYGFVLYAREEDACNAVIALQGHYINHTKVQVRLARPEASAKRVYPVLAQQHELQSRLYAGAAAQQSYGSSTTSAALDSAAMSSAGMSSTSSNSGDAPAPCAVEEERRAPTPVAAAAPAPTTTVDAATYQAMLQLLAYYSNAASATQVSPATAYADADCGGCTTSAFGQADLGTQSPACATDNTNGQYDSYYYYMYLAQLQQQQLMQQQ